MTDDLVTRLEALASNYKTSEFEFVYANYETVCEAGAEIERLRAEVDGWRKLALAEHWLRVPNHLACDCLDKAVRGD